MLQHVLKSFYTVKVLCEMVCDNVKSATDGFTKEYVKCPLRNLFGDTLGNNHEIDELRRDVQQLRSEITELNALVRTGEAAVSH